MTVGVSTTLAATQLGTPIATAWFKLHTGDPGAAGATAAAAGDTSRKQVTWNAVSAGARSMASMSGAWTNGGTSETISHVSVWDASTAGNFLYSFALTTPQPWNTGNTYTQTAHSYSITPIAA